MQTSEINLYASNKKRSAMDNMISAVHSLSDAEYKLYKKRIGNDSIKLTCLEMVRDNQLISSNNLMNELGYGSNRAAFYTLKHRIIDDIIKIKQEWGRSEIIQTLEEIDNLRTLMYSQDPNLLLKSLKRLEKKALKLDVLRGLTEIYFCYYTIGYDDVNVRRKMERRIESSRRKAKDLLALERIFYTVALGYQDLFYAPINAEFTDAEQLLSEAERLHQNLQINTSEFIYLSCKLTIKLRPGVNLKSGKLKADLDRLYELYLTTPVEYRYPHCRPAIELLLCKYYYLQPNEEKLTDMLSSLGETIHHIKGYRLYANVYFYYLFINSVRLLASGKANEISPFLFRNVDDKLLASASQKMLNYYHYLLALAHLYQDNYSESYSELMKSRDYIQHLEETNSWLILESSALALLLHIRTSNYPMLQFELARLKRYVKKFGCKEEWRDFIKYCSAYQKGSNPVDLKTLADFTKGRELLMSRA